MAMKTKKFDNYLNLAWTYTITQGVDGKNKKIYIVRVNELPGVCTDAPTIPKALELIKDAMLGAFELYQKHEQEIPVPIDEKKFKGEIAYRTTSGRHYLIAREAQRRGLSLSKVIDDLIDSNLKD